MTVPHNPWITVATVVFNDAPALALTIDSVERQDTTLLEHLIIDGASTDGTAQIAADAAHDRPWMSVVSEPDRGIYHAMNKAISRARGDYVLFLNAGDDFCADDALRLAHGDWSRTHYQWGRYLVQMVDSDRAPTRPVDTRHLDWQRFDRADQDPHHQGAIMSTRMLRELGGFDERFRIVADYELMRRALLAGYQPWESGRVLTCVDAAGVSTSDWQASIREVHHVRTAGAGPRVRVAAALTTSRRMAVVGARRAVRNLVESGIGTAGYHRLRGLTHEPGVDRGE